MGDFKSGFVSIIGRTNVGKSTLINSLVKEKVAITTAKPQTTRTAIRAILNDDNYQIIITDTPGIHKPKSKLGEVMVDTAFTMLSEVDAILFVVEATSEDIGKGDQLILDRIKEVKKPTILVINKIDLVKKESLLNLISKFNEQYDFSAVVPISAEKKEGIEKVLDELLKIMPVGPVYYDPEEYTDQTARQIVEEVIREKALKFLDDEVPHGIYIEVESYKERKTSKGEDIVDIDVTIYCQRESHKGIIIGKGGNLLKKIATYSRQDIEKILGTKVNLKVWVKVKEDWQDKDSVVNKFKMKKQ
ncbi:MAG: GTPase Era [Clostridia bacterium]|nr:GTPase Era [Clostridia bacterium]